MPKNLIVIRLKELVKNYKTNLAIIRSKPELDHETRTWAKQIREAFLEEVTQLVERL